jgi:hypothetical protein
MRRRELLVSAAAMVPVGFSGCTGCVSRPAASLRMSTPDDDQLVRVVVRSVRLEDGPIARRRVRAFDRIRDGDGLINRSEPPFDENRHLVHGNAVYNLSREVVGETDGTRFSVDLETVGDTPIDGERIEYRDLPPVDREALVGLGTEAEFPPAFLRELLYTASQRNRSVLVPDSNYSIVVLADGTEAAWTVEDASETRLKTYRYTVEEIASIIDYAEQLRDRFTFALTDLPDAQRDIVETAIAEGRYAVETDETPSEPFVSLAKRFREHEEVRALNRGAERDSPQGHYLVRYDGAVYSTFLRVDESVFRTATTTG